MKKIGIIGIGKIGSALAYELLHQDDIQELQIYNRDKSKQEALLSSLKIASHQIENNVKIKEFDFTSINNLDLVIISIKDNYDPRLSINRVSYPKWLPKNLRYSGLDLDYNLISNLINKIKEYKGIIAVITNPVELITKYISESIKSLNVVGLGASIDSARISYMLYKDQEVEIDADEILLFGEHGNKLNVVQTLSTNLCQDGSCQRIIDTSSEIGFNIVKKIGYTLYDCIPSFLKDIKWLLSKKSTGYRSFSYFDGQYVLSQPIKKNNQINQFEVYSKYSQSENEKLLNQKLILNENYDMILKELKKCSS